MIFDRKKFVTAVLGKDHPNVIKEGEEGPEAPSTLSAIMSEFIDAVHAKDVEGAAAALKACLYACQEEDSGE